MFVTIKEMDIDTIIQYDSIVTYKYSPVAIIELGSRFAINYDVYLRNGEVVNWVDIICPKEFLLQDLLNQEIANNHLEQGTILNHYYRYPHCSSITRS